MDKCPTPTYCSDECPHIISYCGLNSMKSIIIPKNAATNGDVIKTIFNTTIEDCDNAFIWVDCGEGYCPTKFDIDWWNAPYKKVGGNR